MESFDLDSLLESHRRAGQLYHEFLRADTLSAGLYGLPAGTDDPQQPHTEDEVYYVVAGRGVIQVNGEDQTVGPGSIIFVATGAVHHFHSIVEDLKILVIFAPPRRSRAATDA